ncbi:ABC transporter ATP-binding protein [Lactobacillus sp. ESL0684]|uniref:ATP-binding cassette domain-containing protein n=1 Tax=Lactobacillus sp. ESL0684 TaxID=2983213 RepID=UPI0023F6CF29|nr:ABC transporter ATP-binding protein [Lactobacillus sp. ESL0684]WEV42877.1 ABC transporter ATP-binding protein [Lactobacillus sp. ESL0684]
MTIIFDKVSKTYGKKLILHDINLALSQKSSVIGLVGPNGAGKSTMLRLLSGVLAATSGRISIDQTGQSYANWASKQTTFVVSGERGLRNKLTILENELYFASLKGQNLNKTREKLIQLAEVFNFNNNLSTTFEKLSTGQKKKAAILVAAALQTELILLDEPSNGLDISAQAELVTLIKQLRTKTKKLQVISSHDTHMLAAVADYYIFLQNGTIAQTITHPLAESQLIAMYHELYD